MGDGKKERGLGTVKDGSSNQGVISLYILIMSRPSKFLMVALVCYFAYKSYKADKKLLSGQIGTSFKRKSEKTVQVNKNQTEASTF